MSHGVLASGIAEAAYKGLQGDLFYIKKTKENLGDVCWGIMTSRMSWWNFITDNKKWLQLFTLTTGSCRSTVTELQHMDYAKVWSRYQKRWQAPSTQSFRFAYGPPKMWYIHKSIHQSPTKLNEKLAWHFNTSLHWESSNSYHLIMYTLKLTTYHWVWAFVSFNDTWSQ